MASTDPVPVPDAPESTWAVQASSEAAGRCGLAGGLVKPLLAVACVVSGAALLTPNPGLTLAATWSLVAIVLLLWREGELPILLFALGLQWLAVTMTLIQANLRAEPIQQMAVFSGGRELGNATWMGCLSLVVVALGIAVTKFRRPAAPAHFHYYMVAEHLEPRRVFLVFFVLLLFGQVAPVLRTMSGGLGQVVVAIAGLRYAALTLLLYRGLVIPRAWRLPALAFLLEVTFGFLGYFSTFKEAFLVLAIAAVAAEVRITRKTMVYGLGSAITVCLLASYWMAIRSEYRRTLDGGSYTQAVQVPISTRLATLSRAISMVGPEELSDGFHNGLRRFAYIEFFAAVREYVPSRRPHSDGAIWQSAISHVTKPRLLFPNKPPLINDSVMTNRYTGYGFAGSQQQTSVSMGYVAEAYIDYGFPWMLWPLFALGGMWGIIDRYFREFSRSGLLGVALAVAAFAIAGSFGQGITKLLGATLYRTILYAGILYFAYRPLLRFLCADDPPRPQMDNDSEWQHLAADDDPALLAADDAASLEPPPHAAPSPRGGRQVGRVDAAPPAPAGPPRKQL